MDSPAWATPKDIRSAMAYWSFMLLAAISALQDVVVLWSWTHMYTTVELQV